MGGLPGPSCPNASVFFTRSTPPAVTMPPAAFSSCSTMRAMRSATFSFDSFSRKSSTMSGNENGVGRSSGFSTSCCVAMRSRLARRRPISSSCDSSSCSACCSSLFCGSYLWNTSQNSDDEACNCRLLRFSPG
ncbi:hypothetical protein D9M69_650760 [compost metagenome]